MLRAHDGERAGGGHLRDVADAGGLVLKVDSDAGLGEAHHGAHTHTCGHDRVDAVLGEQHHGAHATTLLVRRVIDDGHGADLAVLHVDDGEAVTVAKVTGALAVQATLAKGWNGNLHGNLLSPNAARRPRCLTPPFSHKHRGPAPCKTAAHDEPEAKRLQNGRS